MGRNSRKYRQGLSLVPVCCALCKLGTVRKVPPRQKSEKDIKEEKLQRADLAAAAAVFQVHESNGLFCSPQECPNENERETQRGRLTTVGTAGTPRGREGRKEGRRGTPIEFIL